MVIKNKKNTIHQTSSYQKIIYGKNKILNDTLFNNQTMYFQIQ